MAFLAAFDDRVDLTAELDPGETTLIGEWVTSRPAALFDELLTSRPTWRIGGLAFLSRHADVREVLTRPDIFSVGPYADAITGINRGGTFLLGLDDGPAYRRDLTALRHAFAGGEARLRADVAAPAAGLLDAARSTGRIDLTDDFARPAAAAFAVRHFGLGELAPADLANWARAIFTEGFVNVIRLPLLTRRAMRASATFRAHLDARIATVRQQRTTGAAAVDTVLERLLEWQASGDDSLTDARMRDMLLWCTAGMIDNVNTAVCSAVDRLLSEPDVLGEAVAASRHRDRPRLWLYVREALRFRTPTPVIARRSLAPHTLARGTRHEVTLPAGTLTLAGVGAAMRDPAAVPEPTAFRIDRPDEHYLHFGAGLHACLGSHLAIPLVTELVATILVLDGLRRAPGVTGRYRDAGPFPKRFVVQFDA